MGIENLGLISGFHYTQEFSVQCSLLLEGGGKGTGDNKTLFGFIWWGTIF